MFDALVQLHKQGDIALDYHFDERMDTHLIDAINRQRDWWYVAYYSGGWGESNAFRTRFHLVLASIVSVLVLG